MTRALARSTSINLGLLSAIVAVDLVLVSVCGLVVSRNRTLRTAASNATMLLAPQVGSTAPPLSGYGFTGASQILRYFEDRRPTLVYTFSKDCPHCERNWGSMRALQLLSPAKIRLVYVDTLDDLPARYLTANGMSGSIVFARLSPVSALAYGARLTPQLELLDRGGKVQWALIGEINDQDVRDVLSLVQHDWSN